jgi:response regulator RpfG family c-di-GMP phosphodiesterase
MTITTRLKITPLEIQSGFTMTEATPTPRTLLLVDDEPNIISALKRTLRRDGYNILTASSAEEGLKLLADNKVALTTFLAKKRFSKK